MAELRSRDIQVSDEGDALRLNARPGALTPELRDRLRERKADILDFLRSAKALAAQPRALVPLRQHGAGAPVFAVPGHNGDVFCWREVAQHLDHPFYGLQPPGLDGEGEPLTRVEDLARYFAAQIRELVGEKPVIIAGYCAGGAVAFELARKLHAAGSETHFVALFASPHPGFFRSTWRFLNKVEGHARRLAARPLRGGAAYIGERLRHRRLRTDDPMLTIRDGLERATLAAVREYVPSYFPGRLLLFLPQNFWARSRFATPLWRAVANRCDAYPRLAACEADAMLTEPHACKVAALFRQAASGSTDHIEVSSVSAAEFARDDARFRDLIGRAAQPNVFMEPALLAAAEAADPDRLCIRVLLAWKIIGHQRTLVGSWAFAVRRDGIARLVSPAAPLAALATPVIDGGCLDNVLEAFLDAVARDPQLPNLMELDAVDNDGPIAAALRRVLSRRHAAAADVDARQRAQLISPLDGNSSLDRVLSTSRRARLRYYRRRLEKLGEVRHVVHETAPEVERGFEAFLELEAAGWKGRRGSAILSDERVARFARAAVAGLAANGLASISALYVEGRPVSMCVILKSGRTAYTWKIAYDESMGLFSPGQLLLENDTAWFLEHPELDRVDSTSARDVGIFAELWAERKLVVNLIVDARCASPLAARAAVLALAAFRLTSMLKARLRARERLAQMLRYRRP